MTEQQQGGTTPEPEALTSVADQASEDTVAAVAVADEPATRTDEPTPTAGAETEQLSAASANGADAPATETPLADAPATETPLADAPATETPLADAPVAETPLADGSVAETPLADAPVAETPLADAPVAETPLADGSVAETPLADAPVADAPVAESPAVDAPAAESPAVDVPAETAVSAAVETPASGALTDDDTADAPAASDDEEPPAAPARPLGPEPTTMEELLAEQDSDIKSFKHGDVVEGQVVRIDKDEILVDIGAKSEGVVSNRELFGRHGEGQPALNIGDTVLVYVLQPESPEGHVVLSLRRAGLERKWRAMQEQFEAGVIIEAPVIDHNKGGLIVDCGIRGFVPISQIVDFPRRPQNDQPRDAAQEIAEKLQPFVGRKLRLKILEVNRKANRLILSEKVALYEERREKRDELFSSLQVGQKVTGTVRSIAPFGVFIDLGGIDGLVHKSELSWNKVNNPEAGYQVGEQVEAEVIDINHERGRISLSIRRLQPDPWHSTVADFKVGDIIDGTVTKLVNFGAFVRVRDGLEGLIHISELSHQRVAHPGDVVHEGQTLKLKIISLDSERHRLGLSLKQAEEPPARPAAEGGAPSGQAPAGARREERRPRPERHYSMSDAVQEPEGGIDNTLASAFAQVRQQLAAAEVEEVADDLATTEAAEEAAASDAVEQVVETVSADEATEEAAAADRVVDIVETVAADEDAEEAIAEETIETIVAKVADDEAAVEAAADVELDKLADVAAANEDNAPAAADAAADVVEGVLEQEAFEEATAADRIAGVVETVAEDEAIEEAFAADEVEEIVETVQADEAAEETAAAATIEEVAETVEADEAAAEDAAAGKVESIARKTMEKNTEG